MKRLKGKQAFYISLAVLGAAIVGSAFLYRKEAAKAKVLKNDVETLQTDLGGVRNKVPTDDNKQFLQKQAEEIKAKYRDIVTAALQWNYVPTEELSPAKFQSKIWETSVMVVEAAETRKIIVGPKAKNLGFDEYAAAPPRPDEDTLQLQRELSAAADIAQLLVYSDVMSIDSVTRGVNALMEEGQTTVGARIDLESAKTRTKKRPKFDAYDTVAFRVRFACTYPALAKFLSSLVAPKKVPLVENKQLALRPQNFLVVNDFWYKVKGLEEEAIDQRRPGGMSERARLAAWGIIPEDLPEAVSMLSRDRQWALRFFQVWRSWGPEQKKIYLLDQRLKEQISTEERERLQGEFNRMVRERDEREKLKDQAKPPEYNTLDVTIILDLVQFNDKMLAELQPEGEKAKPTATVSTVSR